jgi:hypothetical protein
MGLPSPNQAPYDLPSPPLGGGATNPKPPGEHTPRASGTTMDTQSDGSPSLLTPPSLEDTAGFTVVTAAPRQRTTPPHKAVIRTETPSPPPTQKGRGGGDLVETFELNKITSLPYFRTPRSSEWTGTYSACVLGVRLRCQRHDQLVFRAKSEG